MASNLVVSTCIDKITNTFEYYSGSSTRRGELAVEREKEENPTGDNNQRQQPEIKAR